MFSSSLSRRPAAVARAVAVAVAGLALAAFALPVGAASAAPASPQAATVGQPPAPVAERVCTDVEAILVRLHLPTGPIPVCKLVNGWD
ncbi:hypothetical protein [Streptomyces sp. NPDC056061]|uniref:hypothetical protein n=1 Tax=Streptomyces sp. NPDC056061 TaxID=3345700 RepID=UPI0035E27518